ncbi:hypothetical protein [Pedobacter duraquae]|uniref:Uncharacterized protein n=1 Tax=Pedobacter duraquae TaxID=425511 RepID=A0A4R6IL56_9SPHI|nr:hypothetical protein [Pedobacter duraquae]TDO22685.1 hypothetical protein CLV32_1666 [Pedobacter duraquae]
MNRICYILLLVGIITSCNKSEHAEVYVPRLLKGEEDLNVRYKEGEAKFTIFNFVKEDKKQRVGDLIGIRYGDTLIRIQADPNDKTLIHDHFGFAQFVNTDKTCILVQMPNEKGLIGPTYIIALKNGKPEVINPYMASTGKNDLKFTRGVSNVGKSAYLINNDYLLSAVNAKLYTIKRQNPDERIQGYLFLKSSDNETLVFLVNGAFYQVHYPSGETYTLPITSKIAQDDSRGLYKWIQDNYTWIRNSKNISFLLPAPTDDGIKDMRRKI